jgi:hypothetical protein
VVKLSARSSSILLRTALVRFTCAVGRNGLG